MNLDSLLPLKQKLENHPIFERIDTIGGKIFWNICICSMGFYVFVKEAADRFGTVDLHIFQILMETLFGFINEIVMEEESDKPVAGEKFLTQPYQIYIEAMLEVGASSQIISKFVKNVEAEGIQAALNDDDIPLPSMEFMKHTFDLIENGKAHEIASSFAIGRESIVPLMFQRILDQSKLGNDQVPVFRYYLKRHAELDGDHHGPMAHELLENMGAGNSTIEDEIVTGIKV